MIYMNSVIALIASLGLLIACLVIFLLFRKLQESQKPKEGEQNIFLMLQNQIQELNQLVDRKISDTHKVMTETQSSLHRTIQTQFGQSAKIISDVTERLTKLDETNRQVVNFADQLQNLENILRNPKHRGILGEYYLETVLKNVLPPGVYQMQYEFADGNIVDAVVFVKDKIIPIDSKFSLENYNRILEAQTDEDRKRFENAFSQDLKSRIDETSKYVRPDENTTEFAFMFIPSEAVFYDLLINKVGVIQSNTRSLIDYASGEKKVVIVSPTTFLAYLQTVLQGLKAMQIEESAKEIKKRVIDLGKHLAGYESYMGKLGNHLTTTVNSYNTAYKELGKIDRDVLKISGKSAGIEVEQIDKPKEETE